jgi:hypothetical protein
MAGLPASLAIAIWLVGALWIVALVSNYFGFSSDIIWFVLFLGTGCVDRMAHRAEQKRWLNDVAAALAWLSSSGRRMKSEGPQMKTVPFQTGDYSAARRACGAFVSGEADDLRAKLDSALKSGWSMQALKAYAMLVWQQPASDRVTEAAWRLAVEFADSSGCSGGRDFLKRFDANPERYTCQNPDREQ